MSKYVMQQSWAEARRGQAVYGGSVRQYLAVALRLVWAEYKTHPVTQAANALIAEIRARKAAGTHTWGAPYSVRNRGYRGLAWWYSSQRSHAKSAAANQEHAR